MMGIFDRFRDRKSSRKLQQQWKEAERRSNATDDIEMLREPSFDSVSTLTSTGTRLGPSSSIHSAASRRRFGSKTRKSKLNVSNSSLNSNSASDLGSSNSLTFVENDKAPAEGGKGVGQLLERLSSLRNQLQHTREDEDQVEDEFRTPMKHLKPFDESEEDQLVEGSGSSATVAQTIRTTNSTWSSLESGSTNPTPTHHDEAETSSLLSTNSSEESSDTGTSSIVSNNSSEESRDTGTSSIVSNNSSDESSDSGTSSNDDDDIHSIVGSTVDDISETGSSVGDSGDEAYESDFEQEADYPTVSAMQLAKRIGGTSNGDSSEDDVESIGGEYDGIRLERDTMTDVAHKSSGDSRHSGESAASNSAENYLSASEGNVEDNDSASEGSVEDNDSASEGSVEDNDSVSEGSVEDNDSVSEGSVEDNDSASEGSVEDNDSASEGSVEDNDSASEGSVEGNDMDDNNGDDNSDDSDDDDSDDNSGDDGESRDEVESRTLASLVTYPNRTGNRMHKGDVDVRAAPHESLMHRDRIRSGSSSDRMTHGKTSFAPSVGSMLRMSRSDDGDLSTSDESESSEEGSSKDHLELLSRRSSRFPTSRFKENERMESVFERFEDLDTESVSDEDERTGFLRIDSSSEVGSVVGSDTESVENVSQPQLVREYSAHKASLGDSSLSSPARSRGTSSGDTALTPVLGQRDLAFAKFIDQVWEESKVVANTESATKNETIPAKPQKEYKSEANDTPLRVQTDDGNQKPIQTHDEDQKPIQTDDGDQKPNSFQTQLSIADDSEKPGETKETAMPTAVFTNMANTGQSIDSRGQNEPAPSKADVRVTEVVKVTQLQKPATPSHKRTSSSPEYSRRPQFTHLRSTSVPNRLSETRFLAFGKPAFNSLVNRSPSPTRDSLRVTSSSSQRKLVVPPQGGAFTGSYGTFRSLTRGTLDDRGTQHGTTNPAYTGDDTLLSNTVNSVAASSRFSVLKRLGRRPSRKSIGSVSSLSDCDSVGGRNSSGSSQKLITQRIKSWRFSRRKDVARPIEVVPQDSSSSTLLKDQKDGDENRKSEYSVEDDEAEQIRKVVGLQFQSSTKWTRTPSGRWRVT